MKTPREILLRRHRGMTPRLDALRREALSRVLSESPVEPRMPLKNLWEVLCSLRWHWAGLGAAWLLVAVLNSEGSAKRPQVLAHQNSPTPVQLLSALQEHRRQLLGWDKEQNSGSEDRAPTPVLPPRRSQLPSTNLNSVV